MQRHYTGRAAWPIKLQRQDGRKQAFDMNDNKEKIDVSVSRSGGIMARKLELKGGLSMLLEDWDELKSLQSEAGGKAKPNPDGFLYKLSFLHESVVLTEEQLPAKWRRKLENMDK